MSVEEYCLKITLLSTYASSLVSNPKDEMSRFITSVSDLMKEECRTTILHSDMNFFILIVYVKVIEEYKLKRLGRDKKKEGMRINYKLGLRKVSSIKMS